jgi:3-methyladenine DNA glycosylase AlkD
MGDRVQIARLQQRLDEKATPKTKTWWESYLKDVIPFRGAKMADIRSVLHCWLSDEVIHPGSGAPRRIGLLPPEAQKDLAFSLMQEQYADDKLAGILYLGEVLLPEGALDWSKDVPRFATLFQDGHIYDWNTCDWFCVKVLGPLVQRYGEPCARAIAGWRTVENLWQRRGSGVAFVNLAKDGDKNFPGFTNMLLAICATTVDHPERFAQTGTGWVLRELGLAEPGQVTGFIEAHLHRFSREGLQRAVTKLDTETQTRLKQMHRERRPDSDRP